ncbi:hypothetical protein GCM10023148_46330 [Actinokineospora soli]
MAGTAEQSRADDRGLCVWQGDPRLGLQVRPSGNPLAAVYRRSGSWQVFAPITIAGQPAVTIATAQPGTGCVLVVGTAPGQGLELDLSAKSTGSDWCGRLVRIAEAMITELRK